MRPYRTNVSEVPLEQGLREDEGWIDMRVQFLIDERSAGSSELVLGRTVLPPGARHERHRHPNCDEFLVVISGSGEVYTDEGREPAAAGDVVYARRPLARLRQHLRRGGTADLGLARRGLAGRRRV